MFDSTNQAFMNYFDPASYYFIDDVALWRAGDSVYVSGDIGQADTTICYGDSVLLGGHHLPKPGTDGSIFLMVRSIISASHIMIVVLFG